MSTATAEATVRSRRRGRAVARTAAGVSARVGVGIVALAGAGGPAGAWGPSGETVQQVAIVTSTDMLRAIAQVHPPAAQALAGFLPGQETVGPTIEFGTFHFAMMPTPATAELAIRGSRDA